MAFQASLVTLYPIHTKFLLSISKMVTLITFRLTRIVALSQSSAIYQSVFGASHLYIKQKSVMEENVKLRRLSTINQTDSFVASDVWNQCSAGVGETFHCLIQRFNVAGQSGRDLSSYQSEECPAPGAACQHNNN